MGFISVKGGEGPMVFGGKKVIVLGERDGVAGPAIASCVTAGGGEVAYISTQCFV
jgi:glycine/sarcosine/betaine reductase complex component A